MDLLESGSVQCPYCWQLSEIEVDRSAGDQEYVEDCQVCCRPVLIRIRNVGSPDFSVEAEPENE